MLYHRDYPSFFLVALRTQRQRDFCMRVPRGFSRATDAMNIQTWILPRSMRSAGVSKGIFDT